MMEGKQIYAALQAVQRELKAPKVSAERKHDIIFCKECGKEMSVRHDYVKKHTGVCVSCQKKGNKQAVRHGDYKTRLYHIWIGLKHRRYEKKKPKVLFSDYEEFKSWSLSHGYNDHLTIDRIDNMGDYSPANCQWITLAENSRKDKIIFSDTEKIKIYQERKKLGITQIQMAEHLCVSRNTIQRAERFAHERGY